MVFADDTGGNGFFKINIKTKVHNLLTLKVQSNGRSTNV